MATISHLRVWRIERMQVTFYSKAYHPWWAHVHRTTKNQVFSFLSFDYIIIQNGSTQANRSTITFILSEIHTSLHKSNNLADIFGSIGGVILGAITILVLLYYRRRNKNLNSSSIHIGFIPDLVEPFQLSPVGNIVAWRSGLTMRQAGYSELLLSTNLSYFLIGASLVIFLSYPFWATKDAFRSVGRSCDVIGKFSTHIICNPTCARHALL